MKRKTHHTTTAGALPTGAYVRQRQLVPAIIPVSPSTLRRMVADGEFPAPVKLSKRVRAWRVDQVRQWLAAREERHG